jgi:hypothetical protein
MSGTMIRITFRRLNRPLDASVSRLKTLSDMTINRSA